MAVPGPARHPTSVRMGSRCCSCPLVEEAQPSQAAALPCSAAQGEPLEAWALLLPSRIMLLAPSQQSAFPPTVAGGHSCGISFPVCLSRVANPHQGLRRGGTYLCVECKAFLVDTQQGLPSLDPALMYRAHCPKCIPSDSSPTFMPCDGSMAVLHPVLH